MFGINQKMVIPLPTDNGPMTAEATWCGDLEVEGEIIGVDGHMIGNDLLLIAIRIDPSKLKGEYCMRMAKVKTDVDEPLPTRKMETKEQG